MKKDISQIAGLIILLLLLNACGLRPVYEKNTEMTQLHQVKIVAPDNRDSQMLRSALEDIIYANGKMEQENYILTPNLGLTVIPLSIELDGTTRRYRLTANSNYILKDAKTGKILKTGTIQRFNSYNIATADYSTYVASKDAKKLLLEAIAEELRLKLINYFSDNPA
jgi:hypothetical protein